MYRDGRWSIRMNGKEGDPMPECQRMAGDMALAGEWLGLGKERRGSVDWLAIGFM